MKTESREGVKNALWALGFALGIWFLVDQNMRETIEEVPAAIAVEPPPGVSITYLDFPDPSDKPRAYIAISAPKNVLDKRSEWNLAGTTHLDAQAPLGKAIEIPLSSFRFNLPPEADLVMQSSHPQTVRVLLEEQRRAQLPVDVVIANDVPPGWEVDPDSVLAEPPTVEAVGPKEKMLSEPHVKTEPIDVRKQFEYKRWKLTDLKDRQLDVFSARLEPDPGIAVAGPVRVSMLVKPALSETTLEVVPDIVVPVPGLVIKDPVTLKDQAYRLDPPAGGEKVTITLRGLDVAQLADPKIREERGLRVLAIVPRETLKNLPKLVGILTTLPIDVKLPDGITLKSSDKKLTYDVNVNLVETAAPRPAPP